VADDALTLSALISEGALENPDPLSALGRLTLDEGSRKVRSQLSSALGKAQVPAAKNPRRELRFSLLAGFPDRVVKKRTEQEVQLSSGGSAKISPELIAAHAFSDHELAVALEVQETKHQGQARAQAQIRSICAIEPEWLFDLSPTLLREVSEASWDSARSRVTASEKLVYGEITLSESPSTAMDEAQVARILSKVAFGFSLEDLALKPIPEILLALGKAFDPEVVEATVARVELLAKFFPESGLAPPSSAGLAEDLAALLSGKRSLEEVRGADFTEAFLAALDNRVPGISARIEQAFPLHFTLPGGRRARVGYRLGQPPWLESRLQDFFGMGKTPSLAQGRVPLTLHLLAPNQRAVQVTSDLAGFWQRGYAEVRKELSRRYPRHAWPEDPLHAKPEPPRKRGS
ncbi:MAG: ATP-dependent helicase C-terminal domain-containing protein, partial [Bdellovibrionota bacterium]